MLLFVDEFHQPSMAARYLNQKSGLENYMSFSNRGSKSPGATLGEVKVLYFRITTTWKQCFTNALGNRHAHGEGGVA